MLALTRVSSSLPATLRYTCPIAKWSISMRPSSRGITLPPKERRAILLTRKLQTIWAENARLTSSSSLWLWLLAAGGVIGTRAVLSAGAEEDPKSVEVDKLLEEAHYALDKGNYLEADQKLLRAEQTARKNTQLTGRVRLACADLYYALGEWAFASQNAIQGYKMIYGDDGFRRGRGDAKVRSHVMLIATEAHYHANHSPRDTESELEQYVLAPEQHPEDGASYWLLKGRIELQQNHKGKAREYFATAETYPMHKPERHKLHLAWVEFYKKQSDSSKELEHLQLALMQSSTDLQEWRIRMEMGEIYEGQNKIKEALKQYNLAKELSSVSPPDQKLAFARSIAVTSEQRHAASQKVVQLHIRLGQLAAAGATFREESPQLEDIRTTIPVDASHGLLDVRRYTTPHADYAVMSRETYQSEPTSLPGWQTYDSHAKQLDKFGYYGRAYINHQSREIVIAHRGTYLLENWRTNIKLLFGAVDQLFVPAREFCEIVERSIQQNYDGYRISHTGHSLGGVVAEVMACRFDREAVTFESPGSKPLLKNLKKIRYLSVDPKEARVTGYFSEPNFLNTAMGHIGLMLRIYTQVPDPELRWYERAPIISGFTSAKNELVDVTKARHSIASIATLFAQSQRDGTLPLTDRIVRWPDEVFAARFDAYEQGMKDFLKDRRRVLKGELPPELGYKIEEHDCQKVDLSHDLSRPAADFIRAYLRTPPGKRTNPYGLAPEVLACATLVDDNTLRIGKGLIAPEFAAYVNKTLPNEPKVKH